MLDHEPTIAPSPRTDQRRAIVSAIGSIVAVIVGAINTIKLNQAHTLRVETNAKVDTLVSAQVPASPPETTPPYLHQG